MPAKLLAENAGFICSQIHDPNKTRALDNCCPPCETIALDQTLQMTFRGAMQQSEPDYRATMQILEMLGVLRGRGSRSMRVNDLAERLGVNRRTVIRYVKALEAKMDNNSGKPIVKRELRDNEACTHGTQTPRRKRNISICGHLRCITPFGNHPFAVKRRRG